MNKERIQTSFLVIRNRLDFPEEMINTMSLIINSIPGKKSLDSLLMEIGVNVSISKIYFLRFILEYIKLSLEDKLLTEEEKSNIIYLKKLFQIRPGDFYLHHILEVEQIIYNQFSIMYQDNLVSDDEALLKVDLQEIFDLSFDQMNEFSKKDSITSMKQGVDVNDLDVFFSNAEYSKLKAQRNNEA